VGEGEDEVFLRLRQKAEKAPRHLKRGRQVQEQQGGGGHVFKKEGGREGTQKTEIPAKKCRRVTEKTKLKEAGEGVLIETTGTLQREKNKTHRFFTGTGGAGKGKWVPRGRRHTSGATGI